MDAGAYLGAEGFGFTATSEFTRERAMLEVDPYDPDSPGVPNWASPDTLTVHGYLASAASSEQDGPAREQAITDAQLVIADPQADVERGDRIRTTDGRVWTVVGFPQADTNPFTGWQPTLVAALREVVG